jgi:hypothetical protein
LASFVCPKLRIQRYFASAREAVKGCVPALRHAIMRGVKGLSFFGGRIERRPVQRELGLAARRVLESNGRQKFERPGRTERVPGQAAVFVREGVDPDQSFLRHDLAIDEFGPHDAT